MSGWSSTIRIFAIEVRVSRLHGESITNGGNYIQKNSVQSRNIVLAAASHGGEGGAILYAS
jgi:hypothetical protein